MALTFWVGDRARRPYDGRTMAHLYIGSETDSLYLDVTAGNREPKTMTAIADGVLLHVDEAGQLVAIEVMDLSRRGGLQVDDLDAPEGTPKLPAFAEIERLAAPSCARRLKRTTCFGIGGPTKTAEMDRPFRLKRNV
jgi:uncharacterized protein YuzE